MKNLIKLTPLYSDLILALFLTLILFFLFVIFDVFEWIYTYTREHEEYEIDELLLLFLSFPIPLTWFSYRRLMAERKFRERQSAMEQSLAQLQKLEALGTLSGGVAHELNNQLLPVITMSELLKKKFAENDPNRRKIELILAGALNAKETVAKIKKFSYLNDTSSQKCEISVVCNETIELIDSTLASTIEMTTQIAPDVGSIPLSKEAVQSILINLINNSSDALEGRIGEISLSVNKVIKDRTEKSLSVEPGSYARLVVKDSGQGMSQEVQQRIFDPFYTTKEVGRGTGLGLSLVYSSVNQIGGYIFVESELQQGTTITIFLPLIE